MSSTHLIVGLGNPGKEHENTRHNLGFMVVHRLVQEFHGRWTTDSRVNGLTAEGTIGGKEVCLLMPMTYMNNSGVAVRQMMTRRKLAPENLLVVCDDLNLDFGQMRLRSQGSSGGHNGLNSIIQQIGAPEFGRLRLGVGHPGHKSEVVEYVLTKFKPTEQKCLEGIIGEATECCLTWVREGIKKAMELYNRRKENGKE